ASVEVPSSDSGKVKEIRVKEGDEVKAGDVILILEEEKSDASDEEKEKQGDPDETGKSQEEDESTGKDKEREVSKDGEDDEKVEEVKEDKQRAGETDGEEAAGDKDQGADKKKESKDENLQDIDRKGEKDASAVPASPGTRRLAREAGVDIRKIKGSGPGGRITAEDVKSQSKELESKEDKQKPVALPDFSKWGMVEEK